MIDVYGYDKVFVDVMVFFVGIYNFGEVVVGDKRRMYEDKWIIRI